MSLLASIKQLDRLSVYYTRRNLLLSGALKYERKNEETITPKAAYKKLVYSIILQAVNDYKYLLSEKSKRRKHPIEEISLPELRKFFRSDTYKFYCDFVNFNIPGEQIIKQLESSYRKRKIEKIMAHKFVASYRRKKMIIYD